MTGIVVILVYTVAVASCVLFTLGRIRGWGAKAVLDGLAVCGVPAILFAFAFHSPGSGWGFALLGAVTLFGGFLGLVIGWLWYVLSKSRSYP